MTHPERKADLAVWLLYTFSFLLLWEWLRPLEELTATGHLGIFLFFIFICLMMSMLGMPVIPGFFVKSIFILYALHFLYYEGSFFDSRWLSLFVGDFIKNIGLVWDSEWSEITNVFRSLLFFILLWLMSYLIRYWLINRKQIFIFFFMTLVYITVLDTFTPYEATNAIVRTVIAGFAVMGMLTYYRLVDREAIQKKFLHSRKWMVPLVVMIACSVGIGYAAPKADPIWPDPVPFIKSYGKGAGDGIGGTQRVGYGTDDSRLGGPFIGDSQVVFRTNVEARHYWKVETKDLYTGKGWILPDEEQQLRHFLEGETVPVISFVEGIETQDRSSEVFSYIRHPHVIYPHGVKRISAGTDISFYINTYTEKINSVRANEAAAVESYTVSYEAPTYSVSSMRKTVDAAQSGMPEDFIERYTQLPPSLPKRVHELALKITEGQTSWFDKARKIEQYLHNPEFSYDQQDVAVPGNRDDYVDQFLFETKRGYCDNFSSSMAVLLRTVGIPARWVKGYTEGEYRDLGEESRRIYEVTNNNAHSWVEVYFPEVGWVPFEPTQGFSNNVQFNFDTPASSGTQAQQEPAKPAAAPVKPEKKDPVDTGKASFSFKGVWSQIEMLFKNDWEWLVAGAAAVAALSVWVYRKRVKWLPSYYIFLYKRKKNDEYLAKAYLALLHQLELYGLKRKNGQTLRDYARYVDGFFSSKEMSRLTSRYEEFLYRGKLQEGSWAESKQLWENLIKKASA
ncbi:transglutaminase domain-containing protein [Bacillus sp. T33-2]|uniref:transglutaminase domain-containing protein n=1 Tax=Bacillus sp. T33-2 TaxID=2054168 RepID=UPI000C78818C|nr:transglutaminase domain-containing protein [Bacillus sp. T33-2]PLR98670.1 transglutaminase [Bacillus sp. T33-2]